VADAYAAVVRLRDDALVLDRFVPQITRVPGWRSAVVTPACCAHEGLNDKAAMMGGAVAEEFLTAPLRFFYQRYPDLLKVRNGTITNPEQVLLASTMLAGIRSVQVPASLFPVTSSRPYAGGTEACFSLTGQLGCDSSARAPPRLGRKCGTSGFDCVPPALLGHVLKNIGICGVTVGVRRAQNTDWGTASGSGKRRGLRVPHGTTVAEGLQAAPLHSRDDGAASGSHARSRPRCTDLHGDDLGLETSISEEGVGQDKDCARRGVHTHRTHRRLELQSEDEDGSSSDDDALGLMRKCLKSAVAGAGGWRWNWNWKWIRRRKQESQNRNLRSRATSYWYWR